MTTNNERETESKRIIERVARESDSSGGLFASAIRRTRDHVTAADTDPSDAAEYWGTRIGRTLGAIITVVLIIGLIVVIVQGG